MAARKTILVVDDCEEDKFLLKRAFGKAGINVPIVFVSDGQEALDYLGGKEKPCPHLMLLDLKMPKLDGFDVLRWLQKQDGLRRLPVAVLTSSSQEKDVNRAYDLGANSYLVKPGELKDYAQLAEKVRDYWMELNFPPDCAR
jgi:CheY-like chemotaxis protein